MTHWEKIREYASQLRHEIAAANGFRPEDLVSPETICAAAVEHLGLCLIPEHPESANLRGAQAVLEDDVIFINNALKGWYRSYCIAHEIGHARLHGHRISCSAAEIDESKASEGSDSGAEKAVGYGAGERLEREANLFALEFLLTRETLRAFGTSDARTIAGKLDVPFETVAGQLMRVLLIPSGQVETQTRRERNPDESQKLAAESEACPLLVSAGPGTGKTQTLTDRISFLIARGVRPERILALTFSNKAAEEMRGRVAERHPSEAASIEMMTFHAFGLNLLRKYWQRAGLEPHSKIIDKIEALLYLEKNLASLELEHFRSLHEPTLYLPEILSVISRAKDELCKPERFAKLADEMLRRAREGGDDKEILKAEKAVETARVYSFYQDHLDAGKLLDFGDLIFKAVELLERDRAVRANVAESYDAILVDEFQDINRASGILLKEISGDGHGLWAVGDIRQSIYRWRGASPLNIGRFGADFPNSQTLALETNYRSVPEVVRLFSNFAGQMKAAGDDVFHNWSANREGSGNAVTMSVAPAIGEETDAIAEKIREYAAGDTKYSDLAVICRTHNQLVTLSGKLSERGIPVFYLGDVFEREEVRDLLSLLDLSISKNGYSLIRVALLPEYDIPEADVQRILEESRARAGGFAEVLTDESYDSEISARGVDGWRRLRTHIARLTGAKTAWSFLAAYLFAESRFLERFLESEDSARMTARLAIFQFANFARGMEGRFEERGPANICAFLRYVRRLAWFREDKDLAQIPEAAAGLNAVRMLTVHAAKGLEFKAVFLPYLGAGKFPSSRRGARCPIPDGMIPNGGDFHDEEEECLFFVAMSRARDGLHLSRSKSYGKASSNESKHLTALGGFLPPPRIVAARDGEEQPAATDGRRRTSFYVAELERYKRCPREFYYTSDRRLKSRDDHSVYRSFHNLLREVIKEVCDDSGAPQGSAFERFERKWLDSELKDHPYSPYYLDIAAEILDRPQVGANGGGEARFTVNVAGCAVTVSADGVAEENGRVVVNRVKTGKKPSKPDEDIDALLLEAVENANPGRDAVVRKTYLMSDESVDVSSSAKVRANALNRYADAIVGINNREFPVTSKDENCPNCPHYFICPAGEPT